MDMSKKCEFFWNDCQAWRADENGIVPLLRIIKEVGGGLNIYSYIYEVCGWNWSKCPRYQELKAQVDSE